MNSGHLKEKEDRKGMIFWLTGVSGTGKTTLGKKLQKYLEDQNQKSFLLDGDEVRSFFDNDLGYSREERILNVTRIGFTAYCLSQNNIHVVVANIAPWYSVRDFLRNKFTPHYAQIYLKSSQGAHIKRDVKGLYRQYFGGKLKNMIGMDEVYEEPRNPDLVLDTSIETENESIEKLINFVSQKIRT